MSKRKRTERRQQCTPSVAESSLPPRLREFGERVTSLAKASGKQWKGDCPFCGKAGHFYVNESNGLWDCKKCGASGNKRSFLQQLTPHNGNGRTANKVSPDAFAADTCSSGCTLEQYADAKQLPVEFLNSLGVGDISYQEVPAVRIPYFRADGTIGATQYRCRLAKNAAGDDRFRWKSGDKPILYGLNRLEEAHKAGYVIVVEGASDCHTLWYHRLPAIGLPSAGNWREEWAASLAQIPDIYVVIEPDSGGENVKKWLSKSSIRDRVKLVRLPEHKDPSALHIAEPKKFRTHWTSAMRAAVPWTEISDAEKRVRAADAGKECLHLARRRDILSEFIRELKRRGVVGEERAAKLIYLAVTSRLLDRPVNIAVKGPSSGGKSFVTEQTLAFFPEESYFALTSMSEKALVYSGEPIQHRMLVIYEMAGLSSEFGSYLLRSLLSEGRLSYQTVEKNLDGLQARTIDREGPTGLIVTTTALKLHNENETRLLSVSIADDAKQTRAVLAAMANEDHPGKEGLEVWHALQVWLAGQQTRVVIPYAKRLAALMQPIAVRLRRDFKHVLTLIKSHAILHQASRKRDSKGRIVATLTDYEAVRVLVDEVIAVGVDASISKDVRATVEAVKALTKNGKAVNNMAVAERLGLDLSAALRRVQKAIAAGFVKNRETRKGQPARLIIGDQKLPECDRGVLPHPKALARLQCRGRG